MIDLRSLRLGNVVKVGGVAYIIKEIYSNVVKLNVLMSFDPQPTSIDPIGITSDLLISLGLDHILKDVFQYSIEGTGIVYVIKKTEFSWRYEFFPEDPAKGLECFKAIRHLHELQNEMFDSGFDFKIDLNKIKL
jgi:hypothetical protein